jgi:YgiT-type zinc finger domain-containing protein
MATDLSIPEQPSEPLPCTECQAGVMRLRFITYFTWLSDELISVPNFPAWICDVCGRREYDEKSIAWLTMLLNPEAGKPSGRKPRIPRRRPRRLPPRTAAES